MSMPAAKSAKTTPSATTGPLSANGRSIAISNRGWVRNPNSMVASLVPLAVGAKAWDPKILVVQVLQLSLTLQEMSSNLATVRV